jgi:hypothetical protein
MLGSPKRVLSRFFRSEGGAYQIEFALVFPVLILLSLGLLEFSLLAFDYQRAAEAARRGVRFAIIGDNIANTAQFLEPNPPIITCTSTGGVVSCDNASPGVNADARFQEMLNFMRGTYPELQEENIRVTYESADVGGAEQAGGIIPLVTVELVGLRHEFVTTHVIGLNYIDLPDFRTSVLGSGRNVNAV